MIDDYWDTSTTICSFPTSDLRSGDRPCTITPPIISPPPNLTPSDANTAGNLHVSKYLNIVPRCTQIAPGVWSDGCNQVLSAACPDVQAFLACAREEMNLPVASSERVFALAALDVFYRIDDPVHWMFWSERRKDETAEVVNRISLHRPPLIKSRVAWNGISEYLFILASLHGPTSSPLYEAKDWYLILNPPKAQSPPRVPNLRKRKAQQAGLRETPGSVGDQDGFDEEVPLAKKAKTKRTPNSRKPQRSNGVHDSTVNESADTLPTISSTSFSPKDPDSISIPNGIVELLVESPSLAARTVARKPKAKAPQTSLAPDSSTSTSSSAIQTPAFVSHSRNRSASQTSSETSSKTLIAERRSASVLSVITSVEVPTVGKEGMLDSKDDQMAEYDSESEGKPDAELGMVTRGRASKARTTGGKVPEDKVVKGSMRSRPNGRAKRSAK